MKLRLHIKSTEIKQLHHREEKSFHLVTFQAKVPMEAFIELLKDAKNTSVINAEFRPKEVKPNEEKRTAGRDESRKRYD